MKIENRKEKKENTVFVHYLFVTETLVSSMVTFTAFQSTKFFFHYLKFILLIYVLFYFIIIIFFLTLYYRHYIVINNNL